MEKQYCKVGTITATEGSDHSLQILQWQYDYFMGKANGNDSNLVDFFELRAKKVKKAIDQLVA